MPDTFTPEQISQILEEFFKVVGTRQYIGARYVPIFGRKGEESIEWNNTAPYEPLTIVLYQGNSYTSRQFVPVGVEITNQEFWAITGNYNAQVEQYRRETAAAREIADNALAAANSAQTDIDTLLPKSNFSAENTVKKYVDDSIAQVADILPSEDFSTENTVKKYIDDISSTYNIKAIKNTKAQFYGRFIPPAETPVVQSMCISGQVGYFACSNSNTNNDTTIYVVNLSNGSITNKITGTFGHCNSLAVDPSTGKILIAPSIMYAPSSRANFIYICNAETLAIEQTHEFSFNVSCVMSDKKNGALYVASNIDNGYRIYELNSSYEIINEFEIYTNIYYSRPTFTIYTNDAFAYDGNIYVCVGVESYQSIYIYDSNGNFVDSINTPSEQFIFSQRELQGGDFTANGDIFCVGEGVSRLGRNAVGVIFALNITGTLALNKPNKVGRSAVYVNQNVSDNTVILVGDATYAFNNMMEGVQACCMGYGNRIIANSDCVFDASDTTGFESYTPTINLNNHVMYVSGSYRGSINIENGTIKSHDGASIVIYTGMVTLHRITIDAEDSGTYLPIYFNRAYVIITDTCTVINNSSNKGLPSSESILYTRLDINYGNYYYAKYLTKVN